MDEKSLDALERLGRLRDAGALSDDEFEAHKQAILTGQVARPVQSKPKLVNPEPEPVASGESFVSSDAASAHRTTRATPRSPIWARKKHAPNAFSTAAFIVLIFVATLGGSLWFLNRPSDDPNSFMAAGPANVRDAPTATQGRVVAKLAEGDSIAGRLQGTGDEQWVEITDGPLRGRFVWAGNLSTQDSADAPVDKAGIFGGSSGTRIASGEYSADTAHKTILAACNRVNSYTMMANGHGEDAIYDALLESSGTSFENLHGIAAAVDSGRVGISTSRDSGNCVASVSAGAWTARCRITAIRVEGSNVALDRCVALPGAE